MPTVRFGAHAPARHVLVHLSDTHLTGGAGPGGVADPDVNLHRALAAIRARGERVDAVVVTGDLTDTGDEAEYAVLRRAVEPVVRELGAQLVWVAGNHDERGPLRAGLWGGPATGDPVTGVWDLGGLRLVALDTSVPGWHHGDLDDAQLAWLGDVLAAPAPHGTLLAMHHPPLPCPLPFFDILELQHQERLARVIAGTDVRGILAGHLHYTTCGTFAGVPVSVAASTCYTMNLARPTLEVGGMDAGQALDLVHVYDDTVTFTTVPITDAPTRVDFDEEWVERMSRLDPQDRLEAFSRKR